MMSDEYLANGDPSGFAYDCLCRYWAGYIRTGSERVERRIEQFAAAYGAWAAAMGEENRAAFAAVGDELKKLVRGGWMPELPDDTTLRALIEAQSWRLQPSGIGGVGRGR
jgi:hypothetical protein